MTYFPLASFLDAYDLIHSMISCWSPLCAKHYVIDNRDLDKYDVVPALQSSLFREGHTPLTVM